MSNIRWLDAEQQRAWRAYLRGTARLMDRLERDLRAVGLSMAEYEVLVQLSEAPGRILRMAELADQAHQSRSRLTHTIARMESAGLVERRTCTEDRRGVWARLTDEGYARLVEIAPIHVEGVRESFVDVVAPEDFAALGRAFSAVVAAHERGARGKRVSENGGADPC
ncbi:MAG TPA: MarR family transcriptional regulator [Actinopolymorphaceae bacterium]